MGFLEAYGTFDADRAVTYLASDANLSEIVDVYHMGLSVGSLEAFRLRVSFLEAHGYRQILHGCEGTGTGTGNVTYLKCSFDFHAIRSDELGLGPFSGSFFLLGVRDGKIVDVTPNLRPLWTWEQFLPQVWVPFAEWVAATYPEDAEVMYTYPVYGPDWRERLTEQSIQLWDQRSREYVEEVGRSSTGTETSP